jgi:hypothetical protein
LVIPAKAGTSRTIFEVNFVIPAKAGTSRTIYEVNFVIPAKAGTSRTIYEATFVIPAKAGMTTTHLIPAKAGISGDTSICASSVSILPVFKCGNLSRSYANLNFKFVVVKVLFR